LNLRIYFLGTGTAVPIKRGLPCIVLKVDSDLYVFDVGEGCQYRIMKAGLGIIKIKAIFITHMHGDHYLGLFGLFQSMHLLNKNTPLTIVGPNELLDLINYLMDKKLVRIGYPLNISSIRVGEVYSDNKLLVRAYPVEHSIPSYGYDVYVGKKYHIVYTGDTRPIDKVVEVSNNADLLIHEATFTSVDREEAVKQEHSTAADAAKIAGEANVKSLVLTHISPRYSNDEVFLDAYRYFKNTIVAEDYMIIYF